MVSNAQRLQQLSHVTAEIPRKYLRVAGRDGFEHCVVDEDVLVLSLYHVVALGSQARHVTVDIDAVHVLDALQHRVDGDESSRPTNASAANRRRINQSKQSLHSQPWETHLTSPH